MKVDLPAGISTAVGSLPHHDAHVAACVALEATSLPCVPSLPRRSPNESMLAQAVVGLDGVTVDAHANLVVDLAVLDPASPVMTDVTHDAFVGFNAFLDEAQRRQHRGPIKWQVTGPLTLGRALERAGTPADVAFEVAVRAVQQRVSYLLGHVGRMLPDSPQIVLLDEPGLLTMHQSQFPLAPDVAIDVLSAALAVIEPRAMAGVHCCGDVDLASLLAAGPEVVSVPVSASVVDAAGYLASFLERGGVVAWGVVATDGPVPHTVERPWRLLSDLWCALVNAGCDPVSLRTNSMVTPMCGMGSHSPEIVDKVFDLVRQVGARIGDQAVATRITFGA